ncbi:MAG: integrin alpha [Polyangiaceae bacterium]|jgi:hypothetical protein|nr:integrin alpha [Polyangiaceae bacterium]
MRALLSSLFVAALSAGCIWSQFDDTLVNAPVEWVERPGWIRGGYGTSLAAQPDRTSILVGGEPLIGGAAIFTFEAGSKVFRPACEDLARCRPVGVPMPMRDSAGGTDCFAYGVGPGVAALGEEAGLLGGCATGQLFKLPLSPEARDYFATTVLVGSKKAGAFPGLLALASSGPSLVAGVPDLSLALEYPPDGAPPRALQAPPGAESFGSSVALTRADGPPTLAVGAPRQGQVFLFALGPAAPAPRACIKRPGLYGAVLHGFTSRKRPLLAISDASTRVDIVDVALIPDAPDCREVPSDALLTTLRCTEDGDVKGCIEGAFGYALASADLDGDGAPEVIVGAPGVNVRGVPNAGVLSLFRVEPRDEMPRHLFLSSASADDRIGSSIAAFRKDGRVVIASGALTKERLPLFHCASTSPSERCR